MNFRSLAGNLPAEVETIINETLHATSYSEVDSIIHKSLKKIQNTYDCDGYDHFDSNRKKPQRHRSKKKDKFSSSNFDQVNQVEGFTIKDVKIKKADPEKVVPFNEFTKKRETVNAHVFSKSVPKPYTKHQDSSVEIIEVT